MHTEINSEIGVLARVYTETNGGIGETLSHSRLSLLLIDIDRIGEQTSSFLAYCIASFYKEKFVLVINSYN